MAGFLTLMAAESEKKCRIMSCAGTSLLARPRIDSLPRYAPLTDSLPHDARKRPQAWCLTIRKDVAALPGYARKFLPYHMRSHTGAGPSLFHDADVLVVDA